VSARPARTDRGHESVREVQYRERGRALRELRQAARAVLDNCLIVGCGPNEYDVPEGRALADALARWHNVNDTDAD
jgi:hypothetical protein